MPELILRGLRESDEGAFFAGLREWDGLPLSNYTFDWAPGMPYPALLERLRKNALGEEVKGGFVPSTMLYAFVDGVIVGRSSIRHELNDCLLLEGGHVGYAVAPRFRRAGYGHEILRLSLPVCAGLGLRSVLLTCAAANAASRKIIEKAGGVQDADERYARPGRLRYWIAL